MLKENLSKEEAEKLQKAFQSIGGDVTLEWFIRVVFAPPDY